MSKIKYEDLISYVDACENLAASVANDIRKGPKISHATVDCLNKHAFAALKLKKLLDQVEHDKVKLN